MDGSFSTRGLHDVVWMGTQFVASDMKTGVITSPDGISCIAGAGKNWEDYEVDFEGVEKPPLKPTAEERPA